MVDNCSYDKVYTGADVTLSSKERINGSSEGKMCKLMPRP